jgi:RNA polymerase sigma-70 factor (ECF subfamily)
MAESDQSEVLVQHIAEHQNRLFGYIFSMLGDHVRTADVLQETNLVLWRKKQEFRAGEPFLPWAFSIARFQVLAHVRDRGRDRCLLDTDLVELIAEEAQKKAERFEELRQALRECMATLSPQQQAMVQARYFRSSSIDELARSQQKTISAVKVMLLRIRRRLAACIELKLAEST